jgi:hypothetical protein
VENKENDEDFILSLNIHRNVNNLQQLETIYNLTTKLIDILKGKKTATNKGSYAIAGAVGSLASRRFLVGLADRKRIIFDAATAHSLKR